MLTDFYTIYQQVLLYVACGGLVALCIGLLLWMIVPALDDAWHKWLRLDGFGKFISCGAVIMATLYGGSKGFSWQSFFSSGSDTDKPTIMIGHANTNAVEIVNGVETTNEVHVIGVISTNYTPSVSVQFSVRMSDTNEWTVVEKLNPTVLSDNGTNTLIFATAVDYGSYRQAWFGNNIPTVIVTTSDISITQFNLDAHEVNISWTCSDYRATTFIVQWKKLTDSSWNSMPEQSALSFHAEGFWVNKDTEWRVVSRFAEDGE